MYLVISGAGTRAIGWLFAESGASKTILEVIVPYSQSAFNQFMNRREGALDALSAKREFSYTSSETTAALSKIAYERAVELSGRERNPIGIACTGAIQTNPARRGDYLATAAYYNGTNSELERTVFDNNQSRTQHEEQASLMLINTIAKAVGSSQRI